jgi:hypothetical protein
VSWELVLGLSFLIFIVGVRIVEALTRRSDEKVQRRGCLSLFFLLLGWCVWGPILTGVLGIPGNLMVLVSTVCAVVGGVVGYCTVRLVEAMLPVRDDDELSEQMDTEND